MYSHIHKWICEGSGESYPQMCCTGTDISCWYHMHRFRCVNEWPFIKVYHTLSVYKPFSKVRNNFCVLVSVSFSVWLSCLRFFKLKIWFKTKVLTIVKVQPLGLRIFHWGILLFLSYWGGLLGSTHCYFHEFMMKYYHELLKWVIKTSY